MVDLLMWHPITTGACQSGHTLPGFEPDQGGLITSTLLPLVVVPAGFTLIDDLENKFRNKFSIY
jgi:hypothetical protein